MARPRRSAEKIAEIHAAVAAHGSQRDAAAALRMSESNLSTILKKHPISGPTFEIPELPDEDMPTSELLKHRAKQFAQKTIAKDARRLIPIKVNVDGPIGLATFGDPHLDDDGTDIALVQRHVNVVARTEGMFAANAGDTTNNWIGKLARKWAEQSTSGKQAWQLAEWFFNSMPWIFAIGGNHDLWSGHGDPLKWMAKQAGVMYEPHGVRVSLNLPSGRSVVINARHKWRGNSQWNSAHAVAKAVQMGHHDHIVSAGHIHTSGYQVLRDPQTRRICHAIQTASYKTFDSYAVQEGFADNNVFVCPVAIVRPMYPDTDNRFIQVFFDPESGADYLSFLRKRKSERAA